MWRYVASSIRKPARNIWFTRLTSLPLRSSKIVHRGCIPGDAVASEDGSAGHHPVWTDVVFKTNFAFNL